MHRISNIVVSGDEERATARSYVDAVLFQPDGQLDVQALGFYDDELLRTDDGWKIDRRQWTAVQITTRAGVDLPT